MQIFIAQVFMLLGMVSQVSCLTGVEIENIVNGFYNDKDYLDINSLTTSGSYQSIALAKTVNTLEGLSNKDEKHVRNYFAAATIYYATNGQKSQKTIELLGEDHAPPGWSRDDLWIDDPNPCKWYGITCFLDVLDEDEQKEQIDEELIIEIQLYNNTLYGTWPKEIGLLGEHLVTIDLFDNFYHTCYEYDWLKDMKALQYFFFGHTAWDANGIPNELSLLTELVQFDCSYTYWSEGPIPVASFNSLNKLEYVDMGNNIYTYESGEGAMAAFKTLPSLKRFYFENVRFTDDANNDITFSMDFLTELDNVVEAWFDFTKFSGMLPNLPGSLKSFSITFCGLSGNLDQLVNTNAILDRLWLTGNEFSGTIPALIATQHPELTRVFFEGNDFDNVALPADFCNLLVTNGGQLEDLGGDEDQCPDAPVGCCTCTGLECNNSPDPTPAPTSEEEENPFPGICFSGSSTVEVEHRGSVRMGDLVIGDTVRVSNNTFEPIYSFGHKDKTASAEFLRIKTKGSSTAIEISPDHMVAIENGRYVPASLVKKGDKLLIVSNELAAVTSIKTVVRKGIFAPFTASGNIVVNGVVASNYVAYQGSEYVKIGEMETPFSYQFMGHTFNSVHRLAVMVGITGETYTPEGISNWVATAHSMTTYVAGQNVLVILGLALLLPLLMLARLIEMLVCSPTAMAVVSGDLD
eukprot:CAMPEP_0178902404 /NCGR_PEP_ID=MMETSP0786-20121207/4583_1 /TAXON_ID=186022 /ORGANISM="Thalassionema frauenfeldii, Strain CCMP 1798" /LENGTH=690 /DNA_ID=CAMNT_0020573661 /DNA_START=75 /DNA_END=2148 /DNA_ORIENTATION=-